MLNPSVSLVCRHHPKQKLGKKYFTFYCPMVEEHWLQTSKETLNPYYGKEMLGCGKIVKYESKEGREHLEGHGRSMKEGSMHH